MNTEEQNLLAGVYANPGDDAPRLAYRDWLDEYGSKTLCWACEGKGFLLGAGPDRGNPECDKCFEGWILSGFAARAEFIRAQYELESEPPQPILEKVVLNDSYGDAVHSHVIRGYGDTPRGAELRARCVKLFDTFGRDWFPHLLGDSSVALTVLDAGGGVQSVFHKFQEQMSYVLVVRRGFPETLYCSSGDFLTPGYAGWFAANAPLRSVRLTDLTPRNVRRRSGGKQCYAWFRPISGLADDPARQVRLRDNLIPYNLCPTDGRKRWNFDTQEAARAWLSERCIEYARTAPVPG